MRARLKHLIHPERAPGAASSDEIARELPALAVTADSYTFNGNELGRLELRAVNEPKGWRLDKLELASAEGTLSATGLWDPSGRGPGSTQLEVKADVKDVGKYLERFGYPQTVAKGTATLGGTVQWAGPVYRIDYGTLTGSLDLKAERGQFVKVKPGVGRLLGVLSLQSLPRRISLDFRDVFSDGFAFDAVNGSAKIAQGVATTDNLAMTGPAASVAIAGRADLANETQDLTVRVVPVLGDGGRGRGRRGAAEPDRRRGRADRAAAVQGPARADVLLRIPGHRQLGEPEGGPHALARSADPRSEWTCRRAGRRRAAASGEPVSPPGRPKGELPSAASARVVR